MTLIAKVHSLSRITLPARFGGKFSNMHSKFCQTNQTKKVFSNSTVYPWYLRWLE